MIAYRPPLFKGEHGEAHPVAIDAEVNGVVVDEADHDEAEVLGIGRERIGELPVDADDGLHGRTPWVSGRATAPRHLGGRSTVLGVHDTARSDGPGKELRRVSRAGNKLPHAHAGFDAKKGEKLRGPASGIDPAIFLGAVRSVNDGLRSA